MAKRTPTTAKNTDTSDVPKPPNPGSEAAQKAGCTCPVMDNEYGEGYCGMGDEGIFVVMEGCPLHHKPIDAYALTLLRKS